MLLKCLVLLVAVSLASGLEGHKIIEIKPKNEAQFGLLKSLVEREEFDFFRFSKSEALSSLVYVSDSNFVRLQKVLDKLSTTYSILNDNVEASIAEERAENEFCVASKNSMVTDCYRSHDEINNWLHELEAKYPQRVFLRKVGYSYYKRPLYTITITNGDGRKDKKVVFVDSGMHAREWISPATGIYSIYQLVENFEENKELLADYDWVVMPMINADGYEYSRESTSSRLWRKTRQPYKTCTGADPNRNFDYEFGHAGTSSSSCMETYKGPEPFSEPETSVLRDVLLSLKGKIIFYLTLHSYGPYILYPWGWEKILADNNDELDDVGQAGYDAIYAHNQTQYQVGNAAILLYPAAGASDDFAYARADSRIAVTMELPPGGKNGFDPPPSSIKPFTEESWIGIVAMAKRVMEKYVN